MTLSEFNTYYDQQLKMKQDEMKIHERFAGRICAMIANANRDTKKRRKPYSEEEFMSGYEKKKLTPDQFASMLRVITGCCGGEING